jgi:hypothetical protein
LRQFKFAKPTRHPEETKKKKKQKTKKQAIYIYIMFFVWRRLISAASLLPNPIMFIQNKILFKLMFFVYPLPQCTAKCKTKNNNYIN